MKKKPTKTKSAQIGALAVTHCQKFFEEKEWVFRRADGTTDFGIDSEIEIVDSNQVTGRLFKCQIKGMKSIEWGRDYYPIPVKVSTWNNWKEINLPVIALLVDNSTEDIYWCIPLASSPKEKAKTVSLKFFRENSIKESIGVLEKIVHAWLDNFPSKDILRYVPYFDYLYKENLIKAVDGGDDWMEIDQDLDNKTRLFYRHVLELRSSVGLTNEEIIPLENWYIRNCGIWNGGMHILFGSVFSELIRYITFFYKEARDQLLKRVRKVEGNFENCEMINYFELHPILKSDKSKRIVMHYAHPLQEDSAFHERIESELRRIDALKFSWFKKNK